MGNLKAEHNQAKCGNIFISNCGKYTFVCEVCESRFKNMITFGDHLQSMHFSDFLKETTKKMEEKIVYDVSEIENEFGRKGGKSIVVSENITADDKKVYFSSSSFNTSENESNSSPDFDDFRKYCGICKIHLRTQSQYQCHKVKHKERKKSTNVKKGTLLENQVANESCLYCNICQSHWVTSKELRVHSEKTHGNEIPQILQDDATYLKCKYCYEVFTKVTERLTHESTHSEEKPFYCSLCPRSFKTDLHRELHYRNHTKPSPYSNVPPTERRPLKLSKRTWACQYCQKVFNTNRQRQQHERIHTQEKPYQCEQCGQQFRNREPLYFHRKRHANIRDYECECGKMFFTPRALKDHKAMHSDLRPFKCDHCEKTFTRKKALNAHVMLHSDVKRFECNVCGRRFAQSSGLITHRKSHNELC